MSKLISTLIGLEAGSGNPVGVLAFGGGYSMFAQNPKIENKFAAAGFLVGLTMKFTTIAMTASALDQDPQKEGHTEYHMEQPSDQKYQEQNQITIGQII